MAMPNTAKTSIFQRFETYQPSKKLLLWACVATAAATMIIGFNWGGWVTGGTAGAASVSAGDAARGELASSICVQRFNAGQDASARLAELKAMPDYYRKRQFIEAGGWATMPGQTTADRRGTEGCVTALGV